MSVDIAGDAQCLLLVKLAIVTSLTLVLDLKLAHTLWSFLHTASYLMFPIPSHIRICINAYYLSGIHSYDTSILMQFVKKVAVYELYSPSIQYHVVSTNFQRPQQHNTPQYLLTIPKFKLLCIILFLLWVFIQEEGDVWSPIFCHFPFNQSYVVYSLISGMGSKWRPLRSILAYEYHRLPRSQSIAAPQASYFIS